MEQALRIVVAAIKRGINSRQLAIMLYLATSPENKIDYHELVEHVVDRKSSATQSVKKLEEEAGLVKCERQPGDRRKRFVSLTDEGRAFIAEIEEASDRWWGEQATLASRDGFLTAEESAKFLGIAAGRKARGKAKVA